DIVYSDDEEDVGAKADFCNLEKNISVSLIPTGRVHKDHPVSQIISELSSAPQTRSMARMEEGIDYEEVFALVAKIEVIWLFLDYASFMGFMVYQMDVKSAFLYGMIEEEVYVCQPPGFEDPDYPDKDKREAKGKSLVDLSTRVRDLRDKFKEFSINSTNKVNAASAPVIVVWPNTTNKTNSFNAASPSNNVVSLNFKIGGKSSFVDPFPYPADPDMPTLEDIVYSDDEE
nr:putative ribonuclease H-like domain-containing protein [Tanacetum cinerariifolium]